MTFISCLKSRIISGKIFSAMQISFIFSISLIPSVSYFESVEHKIPVSCANSSNEIPASMKEEIKSVLTYMDQLLENLPEDKIAEFAQSEQFETYKKLFAELGLS